MTSRQSLRKRQLRLSLRSRGALVLTRLLKRLLEDALQILGLFVRCAHAISHCVMSSGNRFSSIDSALGNDSWVVGKGFRV
jgi:hypothetical protein